MGKKVFTIEYLLYAAVFVLAILLRFVHLGQMPLNNFEAEQALQALKFSTGGNGLMGDQPAYVILTAALFKIFSSGNFAARFWPALVGSFAVFLPFLFRRILGQRITFLISLFLAIDPALIAISRTAGAQSLAIVFGVAAVGFLAHKKVIPAGIFLGIAIACGPAFWLGSLILLLVYLISHLFLRLSFFEPLDRKELVIFGVCLICSTALLSTGFLTVPNGITGVSNGLVAFIRGWGIHSLVTVPTALIVLAATYLPVVIIGAFGYFVSRAKRPELAGFFGVWFAAGLFVVLFNPSREIIDWVWVVLPLWGLSALGIETLLQRLAEESRMVLFVQISLTVALLVFSILNMMAFFFNPSQDAVQQNNRLIAAALPLGLLILLTVFLAWGWSPRSAFRGLGLGIGILLFAWIFSASMKNAGGLIEDSGYAWKPQSMIVGEDAVLSQIEDLSLWNHGISNAIDIDVVGFDVPAMQWALRGFTDVTYDTQFPQSTTPSIIIAPEYLQIGATALYRGQGLAWEQYPAYNQMRLKEWLKWTFYRLAPVDELRLIVWARNDLFK